MLLLLLLLFFRYCSSSRPVGFLWSLSCGGQDAMLVVGCKAASGTDCGGDNGPDDEQGPEERFSRTKWRPAPMSKSEDGEDDRLASAASSSVDDSVFVGTSVASLRFSPSSSSPPLPPPPQPSSGEGCIGWRERRPLVKVLPSSQIHLRFLSFRSLSRRTSS